MSAAGATDMSGFDFNVIERSIRYLFREGMTFTLTLTGLAALGERLAEQRAVRDDEQRVHRREAGRREARALARYPTPEQPQHEDGAGAHQRGREPVHRRAGAAEPRNGTEKQGVERRMLGGGLDEGSELLVWVRAVATAILAGVIAQILVQPPGALASVPALLRYGALVAGFVAFMLTRRSIFAGVVCGEIVMLAGKWWLG